MEPDSDEKADRIAHKRKDYVFAENIGRNFSVIETENFYGCDLSYTLGDVNVGKVIKTAMGLLGIEVPERM